MTVAIVVRTGQDRDPASLVVRIEPMRRRHIRAVMRIERQVYPRPWTPAIFRGELASRADREYIVALVGHEVVGYGGEYFVVDDAHVTNIAVDPAWHRHTIGSRLLVALGRRAIARGVRNWTLEVRVTNRAAQEMYRRFGFAPAGVRRRYYENTDDAIVMWAHDIDQPPFAERLGALQAAIPGVTLDDFPAALEDE